MTAATPVPTTHPVPWRIATMGLAAAIGFGAGVAGENLIWNNGSGEGAPAVTVSQAIPPTFDQSIRDAQTTMVIPVSVTQPGAFDAVVSFERSIADAQADTPIP